MEEAAAEEGVRAWWTAHHDHGASPGPQVTICVPKVSGQHSPETSLFGVLAETCCSLNRYRGMKVSNMKQIDAYCELRYGTQVFRTPCVRGSGNPAWNWQFEVKLAARQGGVGLGAEGDCQ